MELPIQDGTRLFDCLDPSNCPALAPGLFVKACFYAQGVPGSWPWRVLSQ